MGKPIACPECGSHFSVTEGRFWEQVDKKGPDECWLWTGQVAKNGRGIYHVYEATEQVTRISWRMAHGASAGRLFVLHRCDVPLCVNPNHLFLGTQKENIDDMIAKGRSAWDRGTGHLLHKRPAIDLAISMRSQGVILKDVARATGMSIAHVHRVTHGQTRTER